MTATQPAPSSSDDIHIPTFAEIPAKFKNFEHRSHFNHVYVEWMYKGLPSDTLFVPKDGIDQFAARDSIRHIMGDFTLTTEHKEAVCAYLMSEWFEDIILRSELDI